MKLSQTDHYYRDSLDGSTCEISRKWYEEVKEKLASYEYAEERGRLVVLPCKVGDTVLLKTIGKQMIIEGFSLLKCSDFNSLCYHCRCTEHDKTARKGERAINVCPRCAYGEKCFQGFKLSDFGKTVFLTPKDTEAALKAHA